MSNILALAPATKQKLYSGIKYEIVLFPKRKPKDKLVMLSPLAKYLKKYKEMEKN